MDKRSLIAILITFAILITWQMLYVQPRQKEAARIRAEQQAVADSMAAERADREETIDDIEALESPGLEDVRSAPETEEKTPAQAGGLFGDDGEAVMVTVDTGPMVVRLSSVGGEIDGVELTSYKRSGGGPAQLVPEGAGGGVTLGIMKDGRWIDLSEVRFSAKVNGREAVDGERIVLGEGSDEVEIAFARMAPDGGLIEKKLRFYRDSYEAKLSVVIGREGELRDTGAYSVSWNCGLALNEKDERWEKRQMASMGRVGEDTYTESARSFGKTGLKEEEGVVVWAGVRSKYFLTAIMTETQRTGKLGMLGDKETSRVGWSVMYPFSGDPRMVRDEYTLYMGPLDIKTLKGYGVGLEKMIDLGRLRFFSKFILQLMMWMHGFIPNYGVVIIIISILTKVLFYRLTHKSFKSMKDMQRLQPRLKELQDRYKDDRSRLNQETMKLYKEAGVNPLGGCLPLLLQMPVFVALFSVLRNTIELRGAPFMLWISDLSSPDVLFDFGAKIPFLGSEFHLLPLLMGAAMYLQSKMSGGSPTGEAATGSASQQKMMQTLMPVMFTFLFYSMPSGLVLYWLVNNIFSIIQQYVVHRQIESEGAVVKTGA
jgi:YidC/Oxa1 family membrane protein insertase